MSDNIKAPLMLAYGLGVDSTAVLVGLHQRGIRPDSVLFADTKSEKRETYAYLPIIQDWLKKVGFPPVTVVEYRVKNFKHWPPYRGLGENCLTNGTLPSLAFGFKSCSLKWKVQPQNAWTDAWQPAIDCWAAGGRVQKMIGYDNGAKDRKRYSHAVGVEDPKYDYWYPLIDWGLDRNGCKDLIRSVGLPVPPKSACYFCLAGETEVLTSSGLKPIRDLVGQQELLVPIKNGHFKDGKHGGRMYQTSGTWRSCEIRSFGIQKLWKVDLQRGQTKKTIRCTAEHRWVLHDGLVCHTNALRVGATLRQCLPTRMSCSGSPMKVSAFGVAQGFVFGDGTAGCGNRPGFVTFHGAKDRAMMKWFSQCDKGQADTPRGKMSTALDLPKFWKQLPPITESRSFLLGWLAGYFAADGHLDRKCAASIESVDAKALSFVRDVCHLLGVRVSEGKPRVRKGFNGYEVLHRMTFCAGDMPSVFWLLPEHKRRVKGHKFQPDLRRQWKVMSVTKTEVEEEVFCAVVPEIGQFTLADEIVTGNCPATQPAELHEHRKEYLRNIVIMEARARPRLDGCKTQELLDQEWREREDKWFAKAEADYTLSRDALDSARTSVFLPPGFTGDMDAFEAFLKTRPKRRMAGSGTAGLWRSATKTRPAMMTDYIRDHHLLPADEIEMLQARAPQEIVDTIQAFANGEDILNWHDFLEQFSPEDALDELPGGCAGCDAIDRSV